MTLKLLTPTPLQRIRSLSSRSKGMVAVPYIGTGATTLLPLASGSTLVTRIDLASVKLGQVDPREVLKYLRRGVDVHYCGNLHAKVYLFGRTAVIGSANLSQTSKSLTEAAIETNDPSVVAEVRGFLQSLCADAVGPEFVKSLVKYFPINRKGGTGKRRKSNAAAPIHSQLWISTVWDYPIPATAKSTHRVAKRVAENALRNRERFRLEPVNFPDSEWRKLTVGDRLVERWVVGREFKFSPPARIVHIAPYGRSNAIVYLEAPKRARHLSSTRIRSELTQGASAFLSDFESVRLVRNGQAVRLFSQLWPASNVLKK